MQLLGEVDRIKIAIHEASLIQKENAREVREYILSGGSAPEPPFVERVLREKRETDAALREARLEKGKVAKGKSGSSSRGDGVQERRSKGRGRSKKI